VRDPLRCMRRGARLGVASDCRFEAGATASSRRSAAVAKDEKQESALLLLCARRESTPRFRSTSKSDAELLGARDLG